MQFFIAHFSSISKFRYHTTIYMVSIFFPTRNIYLSDISDVEGFRIYLWLFFLCSPRRLERHLSLFKVTYFVQCFRQFNVECWNALTRSFVSLQLHLLVISLVFVVCVLKIWNLNDNQKNICKRYIIIHR